MSPRKPILWIPIAFGGFMALLLAAGQLRADAASDLEAEAATLDESVIDNDGLEAWYHLLTPLVNGLSSLALTGQRWWILDEYIAVDDDNILIHEGRHDLENTRYKEWWYFDAHTDSGLVISTSVVLSIVEPHYFLWIYDPAADEVLLEIEHDGEVIVSSWGAEGVDLDAELLDISGRSDTGYVIEFDGETLEGVIEFYDPIEGRGEQIGRAHV